MGEGLDGPDTAPSAERVQFPGAALSTDTPHASRQRFRWVVDHGGAFALLGVLVTFGLGVAGLLLGLGPSSDEDYVAACRQNHNAPSTEQISGPTDGDPGGAGPQVYIHTSCTWPPVGGVADDGRYEVRVETVLLPPEVRSTEGFDFVQLVQGPCRTYHLRYKESKGGFSKFRDPLTLDPGQMVTFEGEAENFGKYEEFLPPDFLEHLTVLVPGGRELAEAWCSSV